MYGIYLWLTAFKCFFYTNSSIAKTNCIKVDNKYNGKILWLMLHSSARKTRYLNLISDRSHTRTSKCNNLMWNGPDEFLGDNSHYESGRAVPKSIRVWGTEDLFYRTPCKASRICSIMFMYKDWSSELKNQKSVYCSWSHFLTTFDIWGVR